ncbi:uncharacterized protein LOC121395067 [Xenopus laevis]|uniref:Uncharacterized protein LOC121395067 n=1 Tax=Xenopus laevis TaxID=8355 RepID=A0A8J1L3H1_XENLA|nr:uncharacterized protein LOC121395067 [Xenopus laevis]XP_041423535.1 uncharacterized protein LOC121395067 [Xenopus laevis]
MVEELNNADSPVKFTYCINPSKINFLDVEIMINDSKLDYTLFRKPTDKNVLLDYSSCHPSPMKRSLPISQFCRVLRNNSDPSVCMQQISDMWTRFKERGYPDRLLSQSLEIAKKRCSESTTPDRGQTGIVFSTKFNACTKNLGQLVRKQWNIVQADKDLARVLPEPPKICYRRGTNLRDLLVKTDPVQCYTKVTRTWLSGTKLGCFRCPNCTSCRYMTPGNSFLHPQSGKRFLIRHHITCNTSHVIYLITCPCGLPYVGKTDLTLRLRMDAHRSAISVAFRDGVSVKPVAKHFLEQGHRLPTFKYIAIDHVPPLKRGGDRSKILLQREVFWIKN